MVLNGGIDEFVVFVKKKTAYEVRISDWSSDVCSSDLLDGGRRHRYRAEDRGRDRLRALAAAVADGCGGLARCARPGRLCPRGRLAFPVPRPPAVRRA